MDAKSVLDIFKEITTIPRESGKETPMTQFLVSWAKERALDCKTDEIGNVLITKQASKGKENVPAIVLQSHQDMVCEKRPGVVHDFEKDPIKYVIEDGWMIAKDTTLGADDGIGIAASLALLDSDLPMGKIECLFTISEETGMDGAFALKKGFFTAGTLINLDSEDEGQLFIGCAGGLNTSAAFAFQAEELKASYRVFKLSITNAVGGHSGDDINKERLNSVQQMGRFLYTYQSSCMESGDLQLLDVRGGNKPNAIARDCEAVVAVRDVDSLLSQFDDFSKAVKEEFFVTEPSLSFDISELSSVDENAKVIENGVATSLIRALFSAPHGVEAYSQSIPSLVETSSNLASVRVSYDEKVQGRGEILVVTSQRSSISSARKMMAAKVRAAFEQAGAKVEHNYEYPGWKPNLQSHILECCIASYKKLFSKEPEVKAIHAGLECGLFEERLGGLDMISFGPTLRGVHAPGERLELASVDKFVALLEDVVVNFK